ncbi:hypothetical protein [Streptomyces tagetis]|uniref:Uncharacterized protein n=1 Tax=Streptomyces tagetis TaxID=2820809 RepID=A0A940XID9_9ACTN|nr:hypothetical protein [Streptomyces sp. RG38]MBQ0830943.1 hypothetical protein [Streptomyces sp. RG38]
MRHPRHRPTPAAAVLTAVAAAVLLTGCQGGGGAAPLTLKGLTETADKVPDGGTDTCPLPYDLAAAAKEAGVDATTGPGSVRDTDEPAATGEGGTRAKPGEPLAENPGALVSCTFHLGDEDIRVHTLATRDPSGVAPLAPVIVSLTASSVDDQTGYIEKVAAADPGEVLVTDSGNVAAVRLEPDGEGYAALLVGAGEAGRTSLDRDAIGDLTEALARQVG